MALKDYYNSGDDNATGAYLTTRWLAQTFTPITSYTILSARLKVIRYANPGNLVVSIKATDVDGKPTGIDLCSGIMDGNTFSKSITGIWGGVTFTPDYNLVASIKYAIVVRATNIVEPNWWYWRYDSAASKYSGGAPYYSSNSGGFWNTPLVGGTEDFMFEVYNTVDVNAYELIIKRLDTIESFVDLLTNQIQNMIG